MGRLDTKTALKPKQLRAFESGVLEDLRALEHMLENNMFENDVTRIGAEQEMFLIDESGHPALLAMEILQALEDEDFTTELGKFNIELNLPPFTLKDNCFGEIEALILQKLHKAREVAKRFDADILLTGILPTFKKSDFSLENMTPIPRYYALDEAIKRLRGQKEWEIFFRGADELYMQHDSVMLEAANTSFQIHYQVPADRFAHFYNIAQVVAAPVLAVSTGSPLFLGKRLWHETRIALFQRSIDTRTQASDFRRAMPRVSFGGGWIEACVTEIYKEDIARFRVLLGLEKEGDPFAQIKRGEAPKLRALQLHNGTVYRWNRPCYGSTNDKAHLRIENRYIPSGPTVVDEVANAAFWAGLMSGISTEIEDVRKRFEFDDVKTNFVTAARRGLSAQIRWMQKSSSPVREIVKNELLPIAEKGLRNMAVDDRDIQKYLDIIRERVESNQGGATWMLNSWQNIRNSGSMYECLGVLTRTLHKNQIKNTPVHEWKLAEYKQGKGWQAHYSALEQFMTTDIFSLSKDDSVELALEIMEWRHIRHIPVEDSKNQLVGMVDYRTLLTIIREFGAGRKTFERSIASVMTQNVPTAAPETSTRDAIRMMKKHGVSCLPVVRDNVLVGLITEHDFLKIAELFFEE